MINAANPNETCISTYRAIVYPNQAAANADSTTHHGFGSSFVVSVTLTGGAGVTTGMGTSRGFTNSDWVLQPPASGAKYT
jgi:hypothetical protein